MEVLSTSISLDRTVLSDAKLYFSDNYFGAANVWVKNLKLSEVSKHSNIICTDPNCKTCECADFTCSCNSDFCSLCNDEYRLNVSNGCDHCSLEHCKNCDTD